MGSDINITYFLGAGASCEHIPIVKNMSEKIDRFIEVIKNRPAHKATFIPPTIAIHVEEIKEDLIKSLTWISKEAKNHNTIDTYAKKLFLLGSDNDLARLKATLIACFYFWQFFENQDARSNIDHRYISLISSFLRKNNEGVIEMPPNVNFVTWNYDMQIELALKYFDMANNIEGIQKKYKSYPNKDMEKYKIVPKIVHLNGIAGLYTASNFAGIRMDNLERLSGDYWDTISVEILLFYDLCVRRKEVNINHVFTFAWEKLPIAVLGIRRAIEIMRKTTHLVIIGYSFPVFNRNIDRLLFSGALVNVKKIYYQDESPDKIAFASTFNISKNKEVHETSNVKQFVLPFEF